MPVKPTYWTTDRIVNTIVVLAVGVAVIFAIDYLSEALLPFFIAAFVAYLIEPLVQLNRRWVRTRGRSLPVFVTLLEIALAMGIVAVIFMPSIIKETDMLGDILHDFSKGDRPMPPFYRDAIAFLTNLFSTDDNGLFDPEHLGMLLNRGRTLLEQSMRMLMHALDTLLTVIYIIFILIDYPQIVRGFKLLIPYKYRDDAMPIIKEAEVSLNRYFRGQGLVAVCAMILYCIGFSIVGIPLALPLGVLVGILYMIPYFQYITIIPVAAVAFIYSLGGDAEFVTLAWQCGLVYVVSQSLCDYVITPHIMGRELGLNPAMILLSLSIWGVLLGIIGMIVALPVSSLIMAYYERYVSNPRTSPSSRQQSGAS